MFLRRSALLIARQAPCRAPMAARAFSASVARRDAKTQATATGMAAAGESQGKVIPFDQVKSEEDLLPPGAAPGTVPTDLDQSTGLERLEILGKMQGVDIFDMKPLDSSRKGTLKDPIIVRSAGEEQYVGCCGVPQDSHHQVWMVISRDRPYERCDECGNVIKMEYVGPTEDPHAHDHGHGEHAAHAEEKDIGHFIKEPYLRELGFIP